MTNKMSVDKGVNSRCFCKRENNDYSKAEIEIIEISGNDVIFTSGEEKDPYDLEDDIL